MVRNISGHGPSGAGSTGGPNRPKASAKLGKLTEKVGAFAEPSIGANVNITMARLRKTSGSGLPMADEEPSSPGEVRSTAKDIGKKALSVLTTKGFSKQLAKLPRSAPFEV